MIAAVRILIHETVISNSASSDKGTAVVRVGTELLNFPNDDTPSFGDLRKISIAGGLSQGYSWRIAPYSSDSVTSQSVERQSSLRLQLREGEAPIRSRPSQDSAVFETLANQCTLCIDDSRFSSHTMLLSMHISNKQLPRARAILYLPVHD